MEAGRSAATDQSFDRSESITLNEVCSAARPRTAISPGTVSMASGPEVVVITIICVQAVLAVCLLQRMIAVTSLMVSL